MVLYIRRQRKFIFFAAMYKTEDFLPPSPGSEAVSISGVPPFSLGARALFSPPYHPARADFGATPKRVTIPSWGNLMEGDCASTESANCFAAAKRTEARTIRHFAENFAGVLKYTVPMDKVYDNLSIGTCDGVNRSAESLTKPATYPARGIWSAISNGQSARLITGDILVRLQGGPPKIDFY